MSASTRTGPRSPARLTGEGPWSGYDEQSVEAIKKAVGDIDAQQAKTVRDYERARKDRTGVLEAAEQRMDSN